jgi:ABC-type molybdenum transport system ATPase subunit/photorepair protein PhrA
MLGLRIQDKIPSWISHIAFVDSSSHFTARPKEEILSLPQYQKSLRITDTSDSTNANGQVAHVAFPERGQEKNLVVDMKNVTVAYASASRTVLSSINWQIHSGDRWHLIGSNGSGKTTLLSLLTGDHPQSYTQRPPPGSDDKRHLHLFGQPRQKTPTPHLHAKIGILSPELFDAFPRRNNMSIAEVIGTGFDGTFVASGPESIGSGLLNTLSEGEIKWRMKRRDEVLREFAPLLLDPGATQKDDAQLDELAKTPFSSLPIPSQRLVLLLRAIVGHPPFLVLDEAFSGMDSRMIDKATRYLLSEEGVRSDQAVVVVSHYEEEVPWNYGAASGQLKRFEVREGVGKVVE